MIPKTIIHLLSGGLDSTVLLYDLVNQGHRIHALVIDYGQSHIKEALFASDHCERLCVKATHLQMPRLRGSKLTDGVGTYVVPNRNAVLLSIACNLAVTANSEAVTVGSNFDDAAGFPDCRPEFVAAFNSALVAAEVPVEVCAPYIGKTKREIVQIGRQLGVSFPLTWSCYVKGEDQCGTCPACVKRLEALR